MRLPLLAVSFALAFASALSAQTPTPAPAASNPGDDVWATLEGSDAAYLPIAVAPAQTPNLSTPNVATPNVATLGAAAPAASTPAPSPSDTATVYLQRAAKLKDFSTKYPQHAKVKEAQRMEAFVLCYAALFGDATQADRRTSLVAQLRKDASLPSLQRYQLASLADYTLTTLQSMASEELRLQAYEKNQRNLIKEFPDQPGTYLGLLEVAKGSSDETVKKICQDLLAMPAPVALKSYAQTLLDRYALLGQSLRTHLSNALGAAGAPTVASGHIAIIYTWLASSPGSLIKASRLAAQLPAGTTLIGVSLDTEVTLAKSTAEGQKLPGIQLYDAAGVKSKLSTELKLTEPDLVYLVDQSGTIRSVFSHDFSARLAALVNK